MERIFWKNLEFMSKEDYDEASEEEARHWQTTTLDSLDMLLKTQFQTFTFYWKNLELISREDFEC